MELQKIADAAAYIRSRTNIQAETAIILGTGLGACFNLIEEADTVFYADIPHFVTSTVESHAGCLVFGHIHQQPVVVMQGRFHFYEGYTMDEVTFPIRVFKLLGINLLMASNACGALNGSYLAGELMLLDDHINFLPTNPLVGKNINELGPRFPDMSRPYDQHLNRLLKEIAQSEDITMHEGVYAAWIGPSLETRAEYRFLKLAGADVVGMSTVPEVIVARHMQMRVVAISVITDLCDPDHLQEASLASILNYAAEGGKNLVKIMDRFFKTGYNKK